MVACLNALVLTFVPSRSSTMSSRSACPNCRLEDQRQEERQKIEISVGSNETEKLAAQGKSPFAETMRTLMRLSSSYRRCYWKSGSESIFPMLFGHMCFSSHSCWTLFVQKALYLATQSFENACPRDAHRQYVAPQDAERIVCTFQGKSIPLPADWQLVEALPHEAEMRSSVEDGLPGDVRGLPGQRNK